MDIKNLMTFLQVAELNSFTKAAERLGYSQSTVSFQIKQLETELSVQLFERINHTVALTEKGREVLEYAHQISQCTRELEQRIKTEESVGGHVRLALPDSLCDSLLKEKFVDFRRCYPGITLKIVAAGTEEMFRLMNHNEVDAILTLDNHIYDAEYVIVKEEKIDVHFVASPGNVLAGQDHVSLSQLVAQPFILTEKGMSYRRLMDQRLAELSLEIRPVLELSSTDLICSLVEQEVGISFLPDFVTAEKKAEGKLVYLEVEEVQIYVWKQLLYHRDKWISPQLKSVMDYCISREF